MVKAGGIVDPESTVIIVRQAPEIALKAHRARRRLVRALERNLRDAFQRREVPARIIQPSQGGRFLVETPDKAGAVGILARVFGVGSFSPVEAACTPDLGEICRVGRETFARAVEGKRFAVRAKRLAKVGYRSTDVERKLGAELNGPGRVDLDTPDITVRVEVHAETAHLFSEIREGPGGLPIATQRPALALMSGGFDSAVAAWRLMKRGVPVDFLLCNLGGAAYERLVLQVVKILSEMWAHGYRPRFYVVDFAEMVRELRAQVSGHYYQVVLKRLMYRAGAEVACAEDAAALITGEAIGQVSSQTLGNLQAIEPAAGTMPVLRPLAGFDKQEIIEAARHIGTAPLSERVREVCGLGDHKPVVNTRPEKVAREEAKLDPATLSAALAQRKTIDVHGVTAGDLRQPYLFVDFVPQEAVVLDCQPHSFYRAWHMPEACHYEPDEIVRKFRQFDKERTYVVYCTWGLQSPLVAEVMQQYGYDAYAFRGGVESLREQVAAGTS